MQQCRVPQFRYAGDARRASGAMAVSPLPTAAIEEEAVDPPPLELDDQQMDGRYVEALHHGVDRKPDDSLLCNSPNPAFTATAAAQQVSLDTAPIVPADVLNRIQPSYFEWRSHPSHIFVLLLLQHRGLYYPLHRDAFNYHMAEMFLYYLYICHIGSYFVQYVPGKRPKELFFNVRLCADDQYSEVETNVSPSLVATSHHSGTSIKYSIPLYHLVGVNAGVRGPGFLPFLSNSSTIEGCVSASGHRAQFPTTGTFSLLFFDPKRGTSQSVDLLTCDARVYDIWIKTFSGIVSVNHSSVVQVPLSGNQDDA